MPVTCVNCGTKNPDQAKFCLECGSSLVVAQDPDSDARLTSLQQSAPEGVREKLRAAGETVEGERKPVTILFADIVGSTSIAEKLDPEEWKEVVAGAHHRVGEAIYRYEGTIAQLLGDGVLAFFGAPITHEDDPIRAVRAALDLQESIREYARELEGFVDDFQMRVGINTGTVVIGDIGTDLHVEYLAIGDAVNVAARLESAAEPGTVLISESSARLIGDDFELVDRGELSVKGKSDSLQAYEVVETIGIPEVRRGIGVTQAAYVGREQELEILQSTIQSLREGQGHIVAVLGEPGIGKSRLVAEVRRTSQEDEGSEGTEIRWLEGRALSYGGALPFWAVTQLLLSDLGLSDGAAEVRIKVALRKRMEELLGDKAPEFFPYLAHLLGLTEEAEVQDRIRSLDGETVKRQTLLGLVEYFRAVAAAQPTVLVLEDVHWADPSSLEAVMRLLPLSDRVPLMVLMPMREERDHDSWQLKLTAETDFPHRFTEVHLDRLEDDQVDQLVQDLLGEGEAEAEIRDLVRSRAAGNPLYLEEIVQHLMERGLIERVNGSWRATDAIEKGGVPETLEGVLLARIDRLEDDVRNTLQLASVIGKSFLYSILEAISEAERELEEHLTQLQRVDLVREKARLPELEYMFKHALTQEAAYNSLLHERRKEFHTKVGEALEELFSDRIEEFLGLLAHHFDAAGSHDKALSYLIQAGDKARLEEAHEEALDLYGRAIQLCQEMGDPALEALTWLKISLIHLKEFNFDDAHDAHEVAFELQRNAVIVQSAQRDSLEGDSVEGQVLRFERRFVDMRISVDSAKLASVVDAQFMYYSFAGLTKVDAEMNVLPHVARSWEVRDDGIRYVFYLRDDVFWTDGKQVTARDFEWAWLRSLREGTENNARLFADDIKGARDYRNGSVSDPSEVGVRATGDFQLEVTLNRPVPYFVYLAANPSLFPVPKNIVEQYGDEWTRPENLVSNGPFNLTRLDAHGSEWSRNPDYFGDFPGNIGKFVINLVSEQQLAVDNFIAAKADLVGLFKVDETPPGVDPEEFILTSKRLNTRFLVFNPNLPPLDDLNVRRALAHSLDRSWVSRDGIHGRGRSRIGGIIPESMPGHSPEIGLETDIAKASHHFEAAGYVNGDGLPVLRGRCYASQTYIETFAIWENHFNLNVDITEIMNLDVRPDPSGFEFAATGWVADYPDPHNFLRTSDLYGFLSEVRWEGLSHCDDLLDEALRCQNRKQRLELYRAVDRYLVAEQVVVVPIAYGTQDSLLAKAKVRGWRPNSMGYLRLEDVSIEPT